MNQERPDELKAKEIVERHIGIQLNHADTNGGVDYRSDDGQVALEVTRETDGRKAGARQALRKTGSGTVDAPPLARCWIMFVSDTQSKLKGFTERVQALIVELENAGIDRFFDQQAASRALEGDPLAPVYRGLIQAGVQRASSFDHQDDSTHPHKLIVSLGSGGSAGGSDEALGILVASLNTRTDNAKKLRESGAAERHLFVWLDEDTNFGTSRPLSRPAPEWDDGQFGLPTIAPQLDASVTHLWVVHERSGQGWYWNGASWSAIGN